MIAPMPAVFSGPKRLGLEEVHTAANRSVLCPHYGLVAKASPARNPASRFGYEGPGGPISAGATCATLVAQVILLQVFSLHSQRPPLLRKLSERSTWFLFE